MKNSKGMIYLLIALIALTVVVGVGLLFFFPKENKPAVAQVNTPTVTATPAPGVPVPDQFDPVEWTRNPQTQPLQPAGSGTPADANGGFTVTLPPETNGSTTGSTLPASPGATFPADVPTTVTKPEPTSKPATTKVPATKNTAKSPRPAVKTGDYWIQVASFKDRFQAENTSKSLEVQGLKGLLTTASVNGNAVVRVRVGPYASETEAGKILGQLKSVKEFEGSYITKATAKAQTATH